MQLEINYSFFYQRLFNYRTRALPIFISGIFQYFLLLLFIDQLSHGPDNLGSQSCIIIAVNLLVEQDFFVSFMETVAPVFQRIDNDQTFILLLDDLKHESFSLS